jgi:hypothetical protein
MTAFLVAQPFRAAEESPDLVWAFGYSMSLHGLTMTLSRGAEAPRLRKKVNPLSGKEKEPFSDKLLGGCPTTLQTVTSAQGGVASWVNAEWDDSFPWCGPEGRVVSPPLHERIASGDRGGVYPPLCAVIRNGVYTRKAKAPSRSGRGFVALGRALRRLSMKNSIRND